MILRQLLFYKKHSMNKFKRIQCIGCSVLLSLATTVGMAYELPPVEKRNANTTDLSVHNAMFLRQNTQAAVIGILKKKWSEL